MRTRYITLFFSVTMLFFSCVKEPIDHPGGDGTSTRVTLSVKSDNRDKVLSRGAESEELISNVHILVFDADNKIVTNEHLGDLSINTTGSISIETLSGENRQIYLVANGDVNDDTGSKLDSRLKNITTLNELKALLVIVKDNGLSRAGRLTMVGNTTVTITKPHTTPILIQMHYLAAKVTVTVKDNTPPDLSIHITGWDVVNIPKKTFLEERGAPVQEDAVNGSTPADYMATNGKYTFENMDTTTKTWAQNFYLFENRRGARVDREEPTNSANRYPNMSVSDNDQRGKAWYAPPGATCMLIYGTYAKDGQMNNVVYKVFLGENPINDYNIFRGKHYEYNVTINSLNNINVDTNVEWGNASFSVDHSDNLEMDAHPDFRVFRIGGTAVDVSTAAYATVEVLETDGTTPCTWLAVSPLNLYRHGIKQSAGIQQQFATGDGTGSFVRSKYTPTPTEESTMENSSFGMTRRLTRIPFEQVAVYTYQNVILYADALDAPGAERKGKVKITYYKGASGDQVAGVQIFDVTQRGAIQVSGDLYIERYEESAMLMHPGLASGLQNTTTMQWGYSTDMLYGADDRYCNGNWLTANAVYNTVTARSGMNVPQWTANDYATYREKYPRQGAVVAEPSNIATSGSPYYYPDLKQSTPITDYFHPLYNSSAARYCHEKNRDRNGDGIIDASETIWYLPSMADLWYIANNMPSELNLTGTYWTSTEEDNENSWAYTFPSKTLANVAKNIPHRVRCVRGKGALLPDGTIESTEADQTKMNFEYAQSSGAFSITDQTGFTWTVTSSDPTWLKIATSAAGAGIGSQYSGTGDKTLYAFAYKNEFDQPARKATITLTRTAQQPVEIEANQKEHPLAVPSPHTGWAGCNIYWQPDYDNGDGSKGRLTFDGVGIDTHERYQGVYFKWGSLVAISPIDDYDASSSTLFSPNGTMNYAYKDVPYCATKFPNYRGTEYHCLLSLHDPAKNTGDICKYITERGWAPEGTWRLPTAKEFKIDGPTKEYGFRKLESQSPNGDYLIPEDCWYKIGVSMPKLYAGGSRNEDGTLLSAGLTGQYNTGTAYNDGQFYLFSYNKNSCNVGSARTIHVSRSVRCVRE